MEVSQSHMDSGSDSNTLDNSTMMFTADANVASCSGFYQRLLLDGVMIPPHSDGAQVDSVDQANFLQNPDDMGQWDWEAAPDEVMNLLHSDGAQVDSMDDANVFPNLDDMEQLDWEPALELNWELSQQQLSWEPSQEFKCPPASETMPEFSTVDQSEETSEMGDEDGCREEDQSPGCGGECSSNHTDESTLGLTSLPELPSGEKIGVGYHKTNTQWESHLWIKGPHIQLHGRRKKGVQIYLGNFETEEEAKLAHDRAAIKLQMQPNTRGKPYPLNFPAADQARYMEEHAHWTIRDFLWKIRRTSNRFSKGKSKLKGVSLKKFSVKRGQEWVTKYEAKISLTAKEFGVNMKRTFMLGNFESEEEAGQAYDRALLFLYKHRPEVEQLGCITNFRPSNYSAEDIEAMASKCKVPGSDNA